MLIFTTIHKALRSIKEVRYCSSGRFLLLTILIHLLSFHYEHSNIFPAFCCMVFHDSFSFFSSSSYLSSSSFFLSFILYIRLRILFLLVNETPMPDCIAPGVLKTAENHIYKPFDDFWNRSFDSGTVRRDWQLPNAAPVQEKREKSSLRRYWEGSN